MEYSDTLFEQNRNIDNLLEGWGDVLNSVDPKFSISNNAFVLDGKAIDAIISTEIPVSLTFSPASPFSSSPDHSPFFSPSSPNSDLVMSSTSLTDSSSDEFEQDLFTLDSSSGDFCELTFMNTLQEQSSAFKDSCLPPLQVASVPASTPSVVPTASIKVDLKASEKKATCKKRRRNNGTSETTKAVKADLSEEELLKFDGKGIETYIKSLSTSRTLSPSEEKELKRIRRLIKNREYAQSSRDKRKQYMEDMEGQLNVVNQEKANLQQKVNALELENKTLKYHLARLMKDSDISSLTPIPSTASNKKSSINKTATVSLFMVLLSFGLFTLSLSGSATPFATTGTTTSSTSYVPIQRGSTRLMLTIEGGHLEEPSFVSNLHSIFHEFLEKYNLVDTQTSDSKSSNSVPNCQGKFCPSS